MKKFFQFCAVFSIALMFSCGNASQNASGADSTATKTDSLAMVQSCCADECDKTACADTVACAKGEKCCKEALACNDCPACKEGKCDGKNCKCTDDKACKAKSCCNKTAKAECAEKEQCQKAGKSCDKK